MKKVQRYRFGVALATALLLGISIPAQSQVFIGQQIEAPTVPVDQTKISVAEARRLVQESSTRIADLVAQRPTSSDLSPTELAEVARIDAEIEAIRTERADALETVVLAERPDVEIVDRARGIYRVPIADGEGGNHWFYGNLVPLWHLDHLDPAVLKLASSIGSQPAQAKLPDGTEVVTHLAIAGTTSQSAVHPFPGDIDFSEDLIVTAPTAQAAAEAVAALVVEFVGRNTDNQILEFDKLRIMPLPESRIEGDEYEWSRERILDSAQYSELISQLATIDGGRVNTDWRVLIPGGRYIIIGNIPGIRAFSSTTGEQLFATQSLYGEFQAAYFEQELPPSREDQSLGEYASLMRSLALKEANRGRTLKAAKRAFNYFRAIANLEAMAVVTQLFATPEAQVIQQFKALEALALAFEPEFSTRVLSADQTRIELQEAATIFKEHLPIPPGTILNRRQGVSDELQAIASAVRERTEPPVGLLEPDATLTERLNNMSEVEILPMIELSLEDRIAEIIKTYIE
ncbi:MAG: hypothetical protein QNJ55_15570 [Xenococcus sp. MO_188.B8]|nr:hypothetical protein [Xenococcus sp. MO_188.B8]